MSRAEVLAHVDHVQERFRARIAPVKWWYRNEIAAAAAVLARELEAVSFEQAEGIRRLAKLIEVSVEEREPAVPGPPSSRPMPDRYSMPPDKEGDEELHSRMNRCRSNGGLR